MKKTIVISIILLIWLSAAIGISLTITKGMIGKQDLSLWNGTATKTFTRTNEDGYDLTLNQFDWVGVDVLQKFGGGVSYSVTTINAALTAVGSSNKVSLWFAPGTWTIDSSVTITANITMLIPAGVIFDGAGTLTINGTLEAGRYPIFGSSITVSGRPKIDEIYPEWWGENSTPGTTDMTTEIQSAINLAELTLDSWHTSIDVDLAPTTYFVSASLIIDASGVGIGCNSGGKAVLRRTGNYGATLSVNPAGTSYVHHNVIHDISMLMQTNAPVSGDIHILIEAGSLTTIKDCYLVDGWQQIVLKGCLKARLTRVQTLATDLLGAFQSSAGFIELTESSTAPIAENSNVIITDSDFNCGEARAEMYYGYAFKISAVDGLWVSGCHFHRSGNIGIYFTPAGAASQITSVKFSNCYIDSQGNGTAGYGTGISFNGTSTTPMRDIKFNNCDILDGQGDGDSTYGVIFNTGAAYHDVTFSNCTISNWGHDGMRLYSTSSTDISVSNCHIYQNDVDAEDASGIKIIDGMTFLRINDNSVGSETFGNGNQLYGIYAGGALTDSIITGNLIKGNGTDTLTIVGAQTRCTVANNEDN